MFNKDFYPTPRPVVEEMLKNEQILGHVILEPSAGKGNILKILNELGAAEVLTCEIIEEFQPYLKENSRFLKPDFLQVTADEIAQVSYIIMNPPFSKAIEHIEHAYNIAPPGCTIVSLCNASNIENERWDYGWYHRRNDPEFDKQIEEIKRKNKRKEKLIHLVENKGFSENLRDCFTEAERKTNVEVAKVVLFKDGNEDGIDFGAYMDFDLDENGSETGGLMPYNEVRDCVNRYVGAVNKFNSMKEAVQEMNNMTNVFDSYGNTQLSVSIKDDRGHIDLNQYKKQLQLAAWQWIFQKLNMEKFQTEKLRNQMKRYIELKSKYPFTVRNIYSVLDMIIQTHGQRMQSTLVEAFDIICGYSESNKTQYEGWKTNSAYKVNKNFIIPYICNGYSWGKEANAHVELNSHGRHSHSIEDVYKALCHMTGTDFDSIHTPASFIRSNKLTWGKWYNVGFFKIRGYKKGTMHFQFLDDKIWETFNRRVGELKGWVLPEETDNKKTGKERSTKTSGVEIYEEPISETEELIEAEDILEETITESPVSGAKQKQVLFQWVA